MITIKFKCREATVSESITYSFYLPRSIAERLQRAAKQERRSASNYLAQLLDKTLPDESCPACGDSTFNKDGVRWCAKCNMAVAVA